MIIIWTFYKLKAAGSWGRHWGVGIKSLLYKWKQPRRWTRVSSLFALHWERVPPSPRPVRPVGHVSQKQKHHGYVRLNAKLLTRSSPTPLVPWKGFLRRWDEFRSAKFTENFKQFNLSQHSASSQSNFTHIPTHRYLSDLEWALTPTGKIQAKHLQLVTHSLPAVWDGKFLHFCHLRLNKYAHAVQAGT